MMFSFVRGVPVVGQWREFDVRMLEMLHSMLSGILKIPIGTKHIVICNVECSPSGGQQREYRMADK